MNAERDLFGGAIAALLPDGWLDASDARPVPDHQEVWLEPDGAERSVIIEILERPDCADAESGALHFQEVANGNEAVAATVLSSAPVAAGTLHEGLRACPAYLVRGVQELPRDGKSGGQRLPTGTTAKLHVRMVVLRLAAQTTDILVTVNRQVATSAAADGVAPPSSSAEPAAASAASEGGDGVSENDVLADAELLDSIVGSLEVRDWGLFGGG